MGKFSKTMALMKASWEVLKKDKEMLVFPVAGLVFWYMFIVGIIAPFAALKPEGLDDENGLWFYVFLFLFFFCTHFMMTFFNAALVGCAVKRMRGGDPVLRDGFSAAFSRLYSIAAWALMSASLGIVLKAIESRLEGFGKLIADIIGVGWGVASYLVVPIMVVENKGPIVCLKESAVLFKKTWGEQFIGDFSFGIAYIASSLPGIILIVVGAIIGKQQEQLMDVLLVVWLVSFVSLALVISVLQVIFQSALYCYATGQTWIPGFGDEMLRNCFVNCEKKS